VSSGRSVGGGKRLSQRLHLSRSPASSDHVPQDLPAIIAPEDPEADQEGHESQWEKRATILARENEKSRSRPPTPVRDVAHSLAHVRLHDGSSDDAPANWPLAPSPSPSSTKKGVVSSKEIDADIQEAIKLHEEGDLECSTVLFGRLADPKGANNPLSQVLYGLALRYVPPRQYPVWGASCFQPYEAPRGLGDYDAYGSQMVGCMSSPEHTVWP